MIRFIYIIFLFNFIFSGTTGKITGNIYDINTSEAIIGCNILITELGIGTASDINGDFMILNVPPGKWTLKFQMIGYAVKEISNVEVSIDLSTKIKTSMKIEAVVGEVIQVSADRILLKKDKTSSTAIISRNSLDKLPVNEISEVLELQAGFVSGHLRGGRAGEVSFMIDGIPMTDGFDGSTVVNVNKNAVQEMQLISGAFNAEYGQAMSGVVNIVTREGNNQFDGSVNIYNGDFFSSNNSIYSGLDSPDILSTKNLNLNFSGSFIRNKLFYFINLRNVYYQGYLKGFNKFQPHSVGHEVTDLNGNSVWHILGTDSQLDSIINMNTISARQYNSLNTDMVDSLYSQLRQNHQDGFGDNKIIPMDWNKNFNSQLKLIYKINEITKLKYTLIIDETEFQNYDRMFKYNPLGNLTKFQKGKTHIFQYMRSLNSTSFINFGVTQYLKSYNHDSFKDGIGYVNNELLTTPDGYSFFSGGSNNNRFSRTTHTTTYKLEYSNQINFSNYIKSGIEFRKHKLNYKNVNMRPEVDFQSLDLIYDNPVISNPVEPDNSTIHASSYQFEPVEFSCFVQDKLELNELILNLGLRFDFFNANGKTLADPSDPSIYNPVKIENRFYDYNINGIQEIDEPGVTAEERESYWYKSTSPKSTFSPRFGASFPFSDKGVIHFSYGHFVQIPRFNLLYMNSDFDLGQGTGNVGVIGNANLNPEKTISYEIGLQQLITQDSRLDMTLYIRDIRQLTGTRSEEISIFGGVSSYNKFTNSDFAFVKGVVFSLLHQQKNGITFNLDYTFQIAEGTASDPYQAQQAASSGQLPEVHFIPLNWDQRHTLNSSFNYSFINYGFSLISKFGSGLPYTPDSSEDITSLIQNSDTKPFTTNTDFRAYYNYELNQYKLNFFFKVFNLFDRLNHHGIYADSGVANRTRYLEQAQSQNTSEYINSVEEWFNNETFYSSPRRIEIGVNIEI
ncbi:MAG: hypothetical protein CMF96_00825 [Candidatus Marinimicrobia bacterium]|nr:hypothetical protein [Candidatus Neomarinimicrobiota bacterium]